MDFFRKWWTTDSDKIAELAEQIGEESKLAPFSKEEEFYDPNDTLGGVIRKVCEDESLFLLNQIKSSYDEKHILKIRDVMNGKYHLSIHSEQGIFWARGKWVFFQNKTGSDTEYSFTEDTKHVLSVFFDPRVIICQFDFEEIVSVFAEGEYLAFTNGYIFYNYVDGKIYEDGKKDITTDPKSIGKFFYYWTYESEYFEWFVMGK